MTSDLTYLQKTLLLETIKSHMSQELRREIMRELPDAYNKWMGTTVIGSYVIDTASPVIRRTETEEVPF